MSEGTGNGDRPWHEIYDVETMKPIGFAIQATDEADARQQLERLARDWGLRIDGLTISPPQATG